MFKKYENQEVKNLSVWLELLDEKITNAKDVIDMPDCCSAKKETAKIVFKRLYDVIDRINGVMEDIEDEYRLEDFEIQHPIFIEEDEDEINIHFLDVDEDDGLEEEDYE